MAKELSRLPIPKEGKPNESRPLSLVHDVWGFINAIAHRNLSAAVEKSGILDDDIMAYRKGRSAEDIATCIVLMLEEASITGEPLAIIMEDEEKFFDRVTPEIQVATMATNGMPQQGWIEIKGEDMLDRKCTLITDIGETTINYVVGMPQGQVLSVLNSNLLCNAKLGQWTAKDDTCKIENDKGYSFASKDAEDVLHERHATLHKKSYSDDHNLPKGGAPPTNHHYPQLSRACCGENRTILSGL